MRRISLSLLVVAMSAGCSLGSGSGAQGPPTSPETTAGSSITGSSDTVGPGESWIAFQWLVAGEDAVLLIRPDGTGLHPLLADLEGEEWHPDWSPDGNTIAFVRHTSDDRTELWSSGANGQGAKMLFRCELPCNEVSYPDWSSDGTSIFYSLTADPVPDGPPKTFTVERYDLATGTTNTVLKRSSDRSVEQPRISPDGSMVAFTRLLESSDEEPRGALFVAELPSGKERKLTPWRMVAMHPDWTADSRIVFDTYDIMAFGEAVGPANLWLVDADGSNLTALTRFDEAKTRASQPRVTPDGMGITFTRLRGPGMGTRQLATIGIDGSNEKWLTPEPVSGTHAQLRPRH